MSLRIQHTIITIFRYLLLSLAIVTLASCVKGNDSVASLTTSKKQNVLRFEQIKSDERLDAITAIDINNRSRSNVKRTGEVYMMRGLANVFSRGIDNMAAKLRADGVDAANFSYAEWQGVANDIVARARKRRISYPIIIIGHSLGGNESSKFANFLAAQNIKVARIIAFDPVETGSVGPNIGKVTNYYLPKAADNRILPGPNFTGKIENVDMSVDPEVTHTNIEKRADLQKKVYSEVLSMTRKYRIQREPEGR